MDSRQIYIVSYYCKYNGFRILSDIRNNFQGVTGEDIAASLLAYSSPEKDNLESMCGDLYDIVYCICHPGSNMS